MTIIATLKMGFRNCKALLVLLVALLGLAPSAFAKRHSYQLGDGVVVTMDVQTNQTVITLTGQSKSVYRLEASEDLAQWTTLDFKAKLDNGGTYTYTDTRALPKCFYRLTVVLPPVP